jgi:flagellin
MIINHNIAALNTHRMMTGANNAQQSSMEKLSSGLRINKAGDDAAGLAISEKMRGQIRGLDQASRNSQDGISLIQTAEGALNETHSILQRMRELAVQSGNDTNTATDRKELQAEVDQLSEELGRIGNTTEFNTKSLLNGEFDGTFHIGANENQSINLKIDDMRGFSLGVTGKATYTETATYAASGSVSDALKEGTYTVKNQELLDSNGTVIAKTTDDKVFTMQNPDGSAGDDTITFTHEVTDGFVTYDGTDVKGTSNVANTGLQAGSYKVVEDSGVAGTFQLQDSGGSVVALSTDGLTFKDAEGNGVATFTKALVDGDEISVSGINISDQSSANSAITTINNALETVSSQRSALGAVQNRLEHTINNLGTSSENLTAAESRIRDVDMAKEMMNQTRESILAQASQSMLAKANQNPQQVLQLLR